MSVNVHTQEELQELFNECRYLLAGGQFYVMTPQWAREYLREHKLTPRHEIEETSLAWAIECAAMAQHAAYCRTYVCRENGDKHGALLEVRPLRTDGPVKMVSDPVRFADRLGNVVYNCVSNGGTDFCPPEAREVIEGFCNSIFQHVAKYGRRAG
jgi:hypothetical protein